MIQHVRKSLHEEKHLLPLVEGKNISMIENGSSEVSLPVSNFSTLNLVILVSSTCDGEGLISSTL